MNLFCRLFRYLCMRRITDWFYDLGFVGWAAIILWGAYATLIALLAAGKISYGNNYYIILP